MRYRSLLLVVLYGSIILLSVRAVPASSGDAEVTRTRNLQQLQLEAGNADVRRYRNLENHQLEPGSADITRLRNLQHFQLESGNVDVKRLRNLQYHACEKLSTFVYFNLNPNPAIVGQTVTLLGNLTVAGSPIGGAQVTIKVNGNPKGTLTTNSTGWFKAGAPAPSKGEYTVRVEYAGSTEYLPSFDEHLLVVETGLSIAIYTDKYTYHAGDTMHLGLNVSNAGKAKVVDFKIWVVLPGGGSVTYKSIPSVTIPAGLKYSNPNFDTIKLPSIPPGTYTWNAALFEPTTVKIIVKDTAEWEFV